MTSRRKFLGGAGAVSLLVLAGLWARRGGEAKAATASFRFEKTDVEWRKLLSPEQYRVLRRAGTEKPFTSPLNNEHRHGTFACAGCAQPVYASDAKFDSGTGWPSFYQPLPNAIGEASDRSFLMTRTEVHCANCGGHLGHVFNDGPAPTGKRYCMNGVALSFTPV